MRSKTSLDPSRPLCSESTAASPNLICHQPTFSPLPSTWLRNGPSKTSLYNAGYGPNYGACQMANQTQGCLDSRPSSYPFSYVSPVDFLLHGDVSDPWLSKGDGTYKLEDYAHTYDYALGGETSPGVLSEYDYEAEGFDVTFDVNDVKIPNSVGDMQCSPLGFAVAAPDIDDSGVVEEFGDVNLMAECQVFNNMAECNFKQVRSSE